MTLYLTLNCEISLQRFNLFTSLKNQKSLDEYYTEQLQCRMLISVNPLKKKFGWMERINGLDRWIHIYIERERERTKTN